ncbi:threonine/serine dehydratase [Microbulbifer halophilus]|uniref:Threonine/serine dehydratase n=1 Tax=Microbulbifer halophilus TaxID=453963 RepID=A0ABW5EGD2_9GAMM|nr:threonine/serine dehydratase [Microbulbifer halophilus]MCW8128345.1 threonine/serine dehydratase [Microbulbifer halophilus]
MTAPLPHGSPTAADIAAARKNIAAALEPTPCLRSRPLEERLGRPLWLKCELLQRTGSFKPRGVLNWLAGAAPDELARGLITVSAGNHGMALAWAGGERRIPVTVVMPEGASAYKVEACRDYGAEVLLHDDIHAAWAHARQRAQDTGATLVPPYDHPRIIAGQGTVGLELLDQLPGLDTVICPVGGGGLISGIGLALKAAKPQLRLIGVEPAGAATLKSAWDAGGPVDLEKPATLATSLGANRAGECTYPISRQVVDELVALEEDAIAAGTELLLGSGKLYAEPGGAIAVAAIASDTVILGEDEYVAAVVSGGNMEKKELLKLLSTAL